MGKNQRFTRLQRAIAVEERRAQTALANLETLRQERAAGVELILRGLGIRVAFPYEDCDVFDILAQIRVDGEHWIWTGGTNRRGSPAVSPYSVTSKQQRYRGASTVVHQIIRGCQHQKAYQPQCSAALCVRPSHRCGTCHTEAHPR